jgi:hypothetical protein
MAASSGHLALVLLPRRSSPWWFSRPTSRDYAAPLLQRYLDATEGQDLLPEGTRPMQCMDRLGNRPTPVAQENAGHRLPGGAPGEGEPHAGYGEEVLETGGSVPTVCAPAGDRRNRLIAHQPYRASALLHSGSEPTPPVRGKAGRAWEERAKAAVRA